MNDWNRVDDLIDLIKQQQPNVILFQELNESNFEKVRSSLDSLYEIK
jgi:hypothetical protein